MRVAELNKSLKFVRAFGLHRTRLAPRRLAQTLGAVTTLPVARLSRMISKGHNDPFIATINDNDILWEPARYEAFCPLVTGDPRHGREGKKAVLYNINGGFNRGSELAAEALSFLFIPSGRRFRFVSGMTENSNFRHYRRSSFAPILFRNSVRSTNSACPASISPIRREISRSQASSTPSSRGASRLWISSWPIPPVQPRKVPEFRNVGAAWVRQSLGFLKSLDLSCYRPSPPLTMGSSGRR